MPGSGTSRDRTPRVLLISSSSPLPATRGGNQRTHHLARALQRIADVDLAYLHWDLDPPDASVLERLASEFGLKEVLRPRGGPEGGRVARAVWKLRALARLAASGIGLPAMQYARDRKASRTVRRMLETGDYDLVVVRYLLTLAAVDPFGGAPVALDADDFEITRFRTRSTAAEVSPAERAAARLALGYMQRRVPKLLRQCAHVWVPSERERRDVRGAPVTVLPNIPFRLPDRTSPAPDSGVVLLVASLRYAVNRRSVDRFVKEAWPRVRARCPAATLRIVGTGMPPGSREAWSAIAGVVPVGFVDDLGAEYEGCVFTVAPIFDGGGTKIKVLESLAYRRACVTTRHVLAGHAADLPAGKALTVADSPGELADRCIALLRDPDAARRQAEHGHAIVRRRFSFDRFADEVERTVEEVVAG